MLSTRSVYNADIDFYRRSERGMPMTLAQDASISDHYDSSQLSRRQTPGSELESKAPVSHRKRVPVACERCRKRKIKCSGDEGGGRGCFNCRTAGHNGCQFLRVQSFNAAVNTTAVPSGRSWQMSRFHPYASGGSHRSPSHTQSTQHQIQANPLNYSMWQNGVDFAGYSNNSPGTTWNRAPYTSNYSLGYEGEAANPFNSTLPSYMLPDPETGPHANVAYMQPMCRPQQNALWLDPINATPITQSTIQNISPSYNLSTNEPLPAYQSLQTGTAGLNRTLPDPASSRNISSASHTSGDTPPLSAVSHPSSVGWQTETGSNASVASSNTSCSGRHDSTNSYANPICSAQDLSFEYPTDAHSPQSTVPLCSGSIPIEKPQANPPTLLSGTPSLSRRRSQPMSREDLQSPTNSACHLYGYSSTALQGRRANAEYGSRSLTTGSTYWPVSRSSSQVYTHSGKESTAAGQESEAPEIQQIVSPRVPSSSSSGLSAQQQSQHHRPY